MLSTRAVTVDVDSEQSAIHAACEAGDITRIRAALLEGEKTANLYHDGLTPLHAAVLRAPHLAQASDVIQLLLDHGADINAQTRGDEDTALHLVVEKGDFPRDFSLVLMLLEHHVDLSVRNRKLRTAYDCALAQGYYELASTLEGSMPPEQAREFYIRKIGEKFGPYIIAAVLRSDPDMLEENILRGGNPNMLNKHGAGAIHYAITHCTLPVMQVLQALAEAGADVNLRDDEGDTALNLAIKSKVLRESGHMVPVVTFLVENGTDPSFQDLDGRDAFQLAEDRGYDDVLDILRAPRQRPRPPPPKNRQTEEFPDPNAPNKDGLYPIHVATNRENPAERHDLVESLLERGARVSQVDDKDGNTALHLCAMKDLGDTAEQLLGHHIDYTVKNKEGKTAYDIAKEGDAPSVAEAIERKEKEVQDKWKKGKKAGFCVIL
ncbi:B-cell lymphoma 3 protein homolog isoform X8 [Babylonia areolata]|uniref:B-cell lymphoma 3 protein homolog isoform X8 n=1 Tax=Babylonia areolata TaxID=304850 RepID=UPI003FD0DE97